MAIKQMRSGGAFTGFAKGNRDSLEVLDGYVVRLVVAGTPTLYVYGEFHREYDDIIEVREVEDERRREEARQQLSLLRPVGLKNIVWAHF